MATEDGATRQVVPLAAEDLARVRRLTEEVKARLYEVGLIMGRTLGKEIPAGTFVKYDPREATEETEQTVEVIVVKLPDGTFCCTADPPGHSMCPC